jgi:hypothetical protein
MNRDDVTPETLLNLVDSGVTDPQELHTRTLPACTQP